MPGILTKGKERIKAAFGKGPKTTVDPAAELAKSKEQFLSAHALATKRIAGLKTMPGAERNDRVKALVKAAEDLYNETRELAQKATKPEEVEAQRKRLADIYVAANKASAAATGPDLADFEKARGSARETLGEMRQLPGAATEIFLKGVIQSADDVITKATTAARDAIGKDEVKAQITALKGVSKLKDDAKRASENFLKTAPKNLAEFEKKRRAASDRLAEVRSLRGMTDDPVASNMLQTAEKTLLDITDKARASKTDEQVDAQIKLLAQIENMAKQAETASKDAKTRAKADLKALPKWKEELLKAQKARDSLFEVSVAQAEYKQLLKLIAKAQLVEGQQGADEALKLLAGYADIVRAAEAKQKQLTSQAHDPAVLKALGAVAPRLLELAKVAPDYAVGELNDQRDQLILLGYSDKDKAISGFGTLLVEVNKSITDLTKQKTDVETKLAQFRNDVGQLLKDGYKESFFAVATQQAKLAESVDFPARDWSRADERLDGAIKAIGTVRAEQAQSKQDWENGAAKRQEMMQYALKVRDWPPLASRANSLVEALRSLNENLAKTGDYAACQAEYLELDLDQEDIDLRAEAKSSRGMPDENNLAEFRKQMVEANDQFLAASRLAEVSLKQLEKQLKGLADPGSTELHDDLFTVREGWGDIMSQPFGDDPAALVAPLLQHLKTITEKANDLLRDPKAIAAFEETTRTADAKRPDGHLAKEIGGMFDLLERADIQLPAQRQQLANLLDANTSDEDRAAGLLKLRGEIEGLVAAEKKKEADRVAKTKEGVTRAVNEPLKRIKGRHKEFQDYQGVLEAEAGDVSALADSDDPYLQRMARLETVALAKKVAAVDPKQRGDDGLRYKAVEEQWAELRKGLAGDMKELLPTTHATLREELAALIGETRRSSPEEGLRLLKEFKPRLDKAIALVAVAKAEKEKYKQRRARLEKQWAQVKKDTKTRVTDRATEFAKFLEARLDEADAALKEENGFKRANTLLQTLEDTLRNIEVSDDPRAELQKQDASVSQDQRAIRDMARDFETELKYFKDTVIPRARELMKERAEANKSLLQKGADKLKGAAATVANKLTKANAGKQDLDVELLESLEATLKNASKPVAPYLKMLGLPKIGTAKTPQLSQAKAAFESARGMLAAAARTVDALSTTTGGTTMSVTQDLKKVEANWMAQVQNYTKTIQAVVSAIREASKDEADPTTKAAAEKAIKAVTGASADFRSNAFSAEIAVLDKKDKDPSAKLAAREKALTQMRTYRKILLEHPVHTQLAEPSNPFAEPSKVRAAARGMLVALKRIELESLIGV